MIFCGRWLKNEALEWPRKGESAWGKGFICLQKMAFRAHQEAQEQRRGLAGHLLRRELHQVSDFGHVIVHRGKPHARASCTARCRKSDTCHRHRANPMSASCTVFPRWQCFHFGLQANPTRAGCNSSVVEMLPPPKTGKPHERESYSLQNTVAVFIMLVMRSNSKPSSRAFLRCAFLFIQTHK